MSTVKLNNIPATQVVVYTPLKYILWLYSQQSVRVCGVASEWTQLVISFNKNKADSSGNAKSQTPIVAKIHKYSYQVCSSSAYVGMGWIVHWNVLVKKHSTSQRLPLFSQLQ